MKRIIIYIIPLLIVAACSKEKGIEEIEPDVYYTPQVALEGEGTQTRTAINNFTDITLGMFVTGNTSAKTTWYHNLGYNNISARLYYESRGYTVRGHSSKPGIGLFKSRGPVNIYGMYPYDANFDASVSTDIPFEVGLTNATNIDYLYTGPVSIDPEVASDLTKALTFKHAMTTIQFPITKIYTGELTIKSIKLEALDSADKPVKIFPTKGSIDLLTGTVTTEPTSFKESIEITFNTTGNKDVADIYSMLYCNLIFPEADLGTATKMKATLIIDYTGDDDDDDDELVGKGSTFTYDLTQLQEGGTPITKFKQAHQYIFPITIYNFIKYHAGYPVIQPWKTITDENNQEVETEIKI